MKKTIIEKRVSKEKRVVSQMIEIYCKGHHYQNGICCQCQELLEYAKFRIDKWTFMKTKTFCSNCKVYCY